ncbi:18 kDa heat shock protein [Dokdonia pacifica]|uniref:Heat shock protein Hsp20 n=1 Tax=Dokdonia pacifica TaxID=1627892 RepID=A0A239BIS5_9FLAO|nr:Hsp20/alpha crystallin family protein [Dokdonia pacifica]GGG29561.1 18 kDa heat shock protein [Dokdonia pacifica]SNS07004.1 heat shock protein Hsp20 [Dokdonia pacifica]
MSLIKFNGNKFPWLSGDVTDWMNTDRFFADDFFTKSKNQPAMNVKDKEDHFEIELAVPGFSKDEIDITVENDILSIAASKSDEKVEEKENYSRKEFSYNSFERKLQIPSTVDQDQEVSANYQDGILKLTLQKNEVTKASQTRKIEIA